MLAIVNGTSLSSTETQRWPNSRAVICCTCRCDSRLLVLAQHSCTHRFQCSKFQVPTSLHDPSSQCSPYNAPIFRLLLMVAVNGTHQCESQNFCGALCLNMCACVACLLVPSRTIALASPYTKAQGLPCPSGMH